MRLIKFIAIYLPFEEFVLKWLPVGDSTYLVLRQLPDALILVLVMMTVGRQLLLSQRAPIVGNRVDVFLGAFLAWSILTIFLNPGADIFVAVLNIKALLRYILLIYIILVLKPAHSEIVSLVRWVGIAIAGQILIGVIQFVGGIPARDFLAARHVSGGFGGFEKTFTGDKLDNVNDLMGTMGDNISFAYLILLGLVLSFVTTEFRSSRYWLYVSICVVVIFLSGSRAITLCSAFLFIAHYISQQGIVRSSLSMIIVTILIGPLILLILDFELVESSSTTNSFWFAFSGDYISIALNQRLGIVTYIAPDFLHCAQCMLGFSPDKLVFVGHVDENLPYVPEILLLVLPQILEDVYWVALFVYYGLIGLLLWLGFQITIVQTLRKALRNSNSSVAVGVTTIAMFMLVAAVPLNFFNQAYEVRSFSFYLWLFCGLAIHCLRNAELEEAGSESVAGDK